MPDERPPSLDALLPPDMAAKAEAVGVAKAGLPTLKLLVLAVLAGAFIALGAVFFTTVTAAPVSGGWTGWPLLMGGVVFCLGLVLVIVAGAELFTGNNLIVMAWAGGKVSTGALLRNWGIVYLGNFLGALGTVGIMLVARQYEFQGGAIGARAVAIAEHKCHLDFGQAVALGALCNALVCLAVWLCFSARTTTDRILAILFPITAFVVCGFEHSVANMYFVPAGIFIGGELGTLPDRVTWQAFLLGNLLPVTIGNILGGSVLVGAVYWLAYLRGRTED